MCKPANTSVDTSVLDGVRLVFNCAIIIYHASIWKVVFLTNQSDPSLQHFMHHSPFAILSNQGTSWVDVFFLLSSCLLVYNLIPELTKKSDSMGSWKVVRTFYWKKFLSIVPLYTASTLSVWLCSVLMKSSFGSSMYAQYPDIGNGFVGGCPNRIWKNVLLINNWGPDIGCGGTNWTMAPTILLYLIAPPLLLFLQPRQSGFHTRFIQVAGVIFAVGFFLNMFLSSISDVRFPMSMYPFFWAEGANHINMYFQKYYICSIPRILVLSVGALMGLLLRTPAAVALLTSHRNMLGGVTVLLLAGLYLHMTSWLTAYPTQSWSRGTSLLVNILCHSGSPLHAFSFAALMLALIVRTPVFASLNWLLNRPVVRALAAYSHGLHFFHFAGLYVSLELIDCFGLVDVFKSDQTHYLSMSAFFVLVLGMSFLLSAVYTHVVEPYFHFMIPTAVSSRRNKPEAKTST